MLFDRDLFAKFGFCITGNSDTDIKHIKLIDSLSTSSNSKSQRLIKEYNSIFEGKLVTYKGDPVKLELESDAKAIFHIRRLPPFKYKAKVEKELEKSERHGVITKIDDCKWVRF